MCSAVSFFTYRNRLKFSQRYILLFSPGRQAGRLLFKNTKQQKSGKLPSSAPQVTRGKKISEVTSHKHIAVQLIGVSQTFILKKKASESESEASAEVSLTCSLLMASRGGGCHWLHEDNKMTILPTCVLMAFLFLSPVQYSTMCALWNWPVSTMVRPWVVSQIQSGWRCKKKKTIPRPVLQCQTWLKAVVWVYIGLILFLIPNNGLMVKHGKEGEERHAVKCFSVGSQGFPVSAASGWVSLSSLCTSGACSELLCAQL